ncbi:hypothetical protein [Gluconobacter potus]|uniref:hypothetical protein n=1 Tax=Gluconobacter potus TaxID=2724927 RepID=UPI0039E8A5A4
MTTTITDPSLQVFSAGATDQLLMWRTDANLPLGGRTVTIAVSDFFLSMASSWMTMWFAALPTTEQFAAVRNAYLASLPTTDPGDGVSDWNNSGVITKSIKSGT